MFLIKSLSWLIFFNLNFSQRKTSKYRTQLFTMIGIFSPCETMRSYISLSIKLISHLTLQLVFLRKNAAILILYSVSSSNHALYLKLFESFPQKSNEIIFSFSIKPISHLIFLQKKTPFYDLLVNPDSTLFQ